MRIVVPSSNQTSWLMAGCTYLLDKHWPEHPPIVMGGYDKPANLPDSIEFIKIGEWKDYPVHRWSDGLIKLLGSIDDDVICIHFDDFWLTGDVDNRVVEICNSVLTNPYLTRIDLTDDRLLSGGAVDVSAVTIGDMMVNFVSTTGHVPYQLSFQTGLWWRTELLKYLIPGETPAETEIRGSSRMSRAGARVLGTKQAPVKYLIVQQHGKLHIDDPGYQSPDTKLLPEDRDELSRLGYLTPP